MVRRRRYVAAALAGAVAAAVPIVARAGYSQAYTVILPGNSSQGIAVLGNIAGGAQANNNGVGQATLWDFSSTATTMLTPAGWMTSELLGMTTSQQVGDGFLQVNAPQQALLWNGSSASFTNLHPAGFDSSQAIGIAGNQQVGQATLGGVKNAALWFGAATSFVNLNPAGSSSSQANSTTGNQQVGYAMIGGHSNAARWSGDAGSFTNLNPSGYTDSAANGIFGSQTVGFATFNGTQHAGLWNGTAFLDLNPATANSSVAAATNGNVQVGSGLFGGTNNFQHALAWNGISFQNTDLGQFLPVGGTNSSSASGVDAYGDVIGTDVFQPNVGGFPSVFGVVWYVGDLYRGGSKTWDDSTAWITNASPTSGDLLITPTVSSATTLQYPNHTLTFGNLWVDTLGSGTMQLAISVGSLTTSTDLIGYAGRGAVTQTGGVHTVTGTMELGSEKGGTGTYNLSGNGSLSAGTETAEDRGGEIAMRRIGRWTLN